MARVALLTALSQFVICALAHSAENTTPKADGGVTANLEAAPSKAANQQIAKPGETSQSKPVTPPPPGQMPNAPQPGGNNSDGSRPADSQQGKSEQKFLTVDLAQPGTYTRDTGTYTLKFINKVPKASYTTSSTVISKEIPAAFDLSAFTLKPTPAPGAPGIDPKCQAAVNKLRDALAGMKCESDISALRAAYKVQLQDLSEGKCTDSDTATAYGLVIDLTEWTDSDPLPALAAGDSVDVTVNRTGAQCATDPSDFKKVDVAGSSVTSGNLGAWKYKIGKTESQWLVYYGFNFAPSGNEDYFSKTNAGTSPTTYTITRKSSVNGSAFSPSVYVLRLPGEEGFSWSRLAGWRSGDYMGGLTAGVGFDFDNPTVFLGYGFGWGYNVMLTAGVVMHKEDRLNGQYSAGQVISENLTSDQLQQSVYKPRAYVGLAFRFGSNPFKSSSSAGSSKPAVPSGGKSKPRTPGS